MDAQSENNSTVQVQLSIDPREKQSITMRREYVTDSPLAPLMTTDEIVSRFAKRWGISEKDAARRMLGGEMLEKWLSDHGEAIQNGLSHQA